MLPRYDSKGQLIVIGALALAIVLVGLALVLNSAIFAENLATRATQDESSQIAQLEQQAAQGAAGAMEHHHHTNSSHSTYDDLEDGFDSSIDNRSGVVAQDTARRGKYVDVDYTRTYTKGTRPAHDGSAFEPQNASALNEIVNITGVDQWVVTPGASQVRGFRMTVDHSELAPALTRSEAEVYLANLTLGGTTSVTEPPFAVAYDQNDDGSIDHSVTIYNSSADSADVNITYRNSQTNTNRTCTVEDPGSTFILDVSNGRVEGNTGDCREVFEFQSNMGPSQLIFVQGDQVAGDYEFIVNESTGTFETDYNNLLTGTSFDFTDYYTPHPDPPGHGGSYSPSSPYVEPALYSAEIRLRYRTNRASYNGTRTVVPDKP